MTPIELTLFDKFGGPLTKKITLTNDGRIASDGSACTMARGRARRIRIGSIGELAALIERLNSSQAIALGAMRDGLPDEINILTKRVIAKSGVNSAIARTGDNLVYRAQQPALVLIDYDSKGMPPRLLADGFWPALKSVLPALASAGYLMRSSTSAGLSRTDTGEAFLGSGGLHVYLTIVDGTDAPRFLKTLHARCWLCGYGWMNVGAAGQLLERSIIDRMVGAPERLVFEGPPVVEPPLHQGAAKRRPTIVAGDVLDSVVTCPPLNLLEQQSFDQLRAREKVRLAPECAAKRAAWIASRTAALVARTGMTEVEARATLEKQADGLLLASVELVFDDPDLAGATVADVLDDPMKFVGETLSDPIEIEDGPGKAKVMIGGDGLPFIGSFIHGYTVYRLRYDAAAVRVRIVRATDAVAELVRLAGQAELGAVKTTALVHEAAKLAGTGVRDTRAQLKAAEKERHARQVKAARERAKAERIDARPQVERPAPDVAWLPVIETLNAAASVIERARQPRRDIDGVVTHERRMPISRTHAFTNANEEEDDADDGPTSS